MLREEREVRKKTEEKSQGHFSRLYSSFVLFFEGKKKMLIYLDNH